MGPWFRGHDVAPSAQVRPLAEADVPAALMLCALDPVGTVLATTRLEAALAGGLGLAGGHGWVFPATGEPAALVWVGANAVPVLGGLTGPGAEAALDALAHALRGEGRRASSIVGPAEHVLGLWSRLGASWGRAREVRAEQPSLVIDRTPDVAPDPRVRPAEPTELATLLPASVAMFVEEIGYSPLGSAPGAYVERVRGLVAQGRAYVRTGPDVPDGRAPHVVYKAELGAVAGPVAQMQGVWVTPERRGEGLAAPGTAAVVVGALATSPLVSLYVNSFNERALATYRTVGFDRVGTYATVLF